MIELNIKHQIFTSFGSKFLEVSEMIEKGSFIHISGDSGIGKTTFFKILAGIITPDFGFIKVNNSILLDTENRIVLPAQKRNISIMFQNYALFPNMTVKQNIAFAQKDKNPDIIDYYLEKFNLKILENPLPKGIVLNVNIPKLKKEEIKGIKVCRQAHAKWEESFDERVNPHGKKYYWLTGYFNNIDQDENADENALADGYISVVPVKFDLTAHEYLQELGEVLNG